MYGKKNLNCIQKFQITADSVGSVFRSEKPASLNRGTSYIFLRWGYFGQGIEVSVCTAHNCLTWLLAYIFPDSQWCQRKGPHRGLANRDALGVITECRLSAALLRSWTMETARKPGNIPYLWKISRSRDLKCSLFLGSLQKYRENWVIFQTNICSFDWWITTHPTWIIVSVASVPSVADHSHSIVAGGLLEIS